jgi:O-glycosyl hydrolase
MNALRADYPNMPKMMTEYGDGSMFNSAWIIHNAMTEEDASAYIFWSAFWPDGGSLVLLDNPYDRSRWTTDKGWKFGPGYWAIKHFSAYTSPGWKRVETSTTDPAIKLSAFVSPDGRRVTAVALNTSDTAPATLQLSLPGYAHKLRPQVYRTAGDEQFKHLAEPGANNTLEMPPQSIATVTFS